MTIITESNIEIFAFEALKLLDWQHIHSLSIGPGAEYSERESFEQIILTQLFQKAIARLNRDITEDAQEQAMQKVLRIFSPDMLPINETHPHSPWGYAVPKLMSGEVRSAV